MDLTIAICAYNAAGRIGMVLDSLSRQHTEGIRWELLVIDNASTDGTAEVAIAMGETLALPLRLLHEAEPGLANARRRAACDARAKFLSFLDDDNVAPVDWVKQCYSVLSGCSDVGIVGARVEPVFENPKSCPPDFQKRFAGLLSMYDGGDVRKRIEVGKDPLPVGAGMTGRTCLFRFVFAELGSATVGRKGDSLAGGEDHEAMLIAHRLGWEIWYSPAMRLGHWVPTRKLTDAYYWKWMVDTALCHAWLDVLGGREPLRSRTGFLLRWLSVLVASARLYLLGFIPSAIYPSAPVTRKWAAMLRSKARGYWRLVADYDRLTVAMNVASLDGAPRRSQKAVLL